MLDFSSFIQRTKVEMKMPREERLIEEEVSEKVAYKCNREEKNKISNLQGIQIQTKGIPQR